VRRLTAGLVRGVAYSVLAVVLLVAVAVGAARLWLPELEHFKPEAERFLSDYLGQEIAMTSLAAEWDGINLVFKASGVRVAVEDHPGSGMRFARILLSFNPLSLLGRERTFDHLELTGATIEISRLPDGRFRVGDTIIGQPRGVVRRLLQGRNLEITGATLVWRDALSPTDAMQIEDVVISIHPSGEHRRFEFTASLPEDLVRSFNARGRYDPESLKSGAWTAAVDLAAVHLNLTRIPAAVQEKLPWQSHGYIDTEFHAAWKNGRLTEATADLTAHDFIIPYARDKKPLAARRFTSSVSWRGSEEDWRLVFDEPEILLDETPVSVSRFEVQRANSERTYRGRDVDVQDLLGVVNRLDIELPWKGLIDRLQPRGVFSEAALTLVGPYLEAKDWRFEGDFRNVGWRAQQSYPGIQGLNGHMTADDRGGELMVSSSALEVDAAQTLRQPVAFDRVQGDIEWYRWGGDWVVDVGDGVASNDDMELTDINFYTRAPGSGEGSPFVLVRTRIERADVRALRKYLPAQRMRAKQVEWLDRALAGGTVTAGRFYLNGPLNAFPYRDGEGELQVSARISDGVFNFNDKWPDLTGLEAAIDLDNSRFEARAVEGRIMDATIRRVKAWSDDFFRRDRLLNVDAVLRAGADDVIQFLRRGPLNKTPPPPYSRMTAQGEGDLSLAIELPFTRLKEASRVRGAYTFDDVALEVMDGMTFQSLSGTVDFTDRTVKGSGLKGTVFGGPVQADVETVEAGRPMTFALNGTGQAEVSKLAPVVGSGLVTRLRGRASWQGRFVVGPGPNRLRVSSDLKGVEVLLPDPLWKPADRESPLTVDVELGRTDRRIKLDLAQRMRGTLHYTRRDGRPVLERGVLNLGSERPLPERELVVGMKGDRIDLDQWLVEIDKLRQQAERTDDAERDKLFDHLRSVQIDVGRFRYLHRNLGPVKLNAVTQGDRDWTARLVGPRVQGVGKLQLSRSPASYRFDMARLYWPVLEGGERASSYRSLPEPSEFASLTVAVEDFRHGNKRLGRLRFEGAPEAHEWRIRELSLEQPEFELDATGSWSTDRFGAHRSHMTVSARTEDLGRTLAYLGMPEQVANGEAELSASLGWPGEPGDFSPSNLNGDLSFSARDGRFLKLDPGSGRLLGLFNAETLTRRFTLDFTDVFKEGLAFDRINGEAVITSGRLSTDGIFIVGPAALLELSGDTSLAEETYDLNVTVAPQLGGNLSLAGAIANPAAGAMIFLMQKLFKKQMAKLIHYEYRVTGDWEDPRVEAVKQPAPEAVNQVGRN